MLTINFDVGSLLAVQAGLDAAAKESIKKWGGRLVAQTRAHIVEEAHKMLHTRRGMFVEGLKHHQVDEDTWVVSLDAKVRWIDDGLPAGSMIDDLLKSKKAKTAKDGSKYLAVPFEHGPKGSTEMTPAQQTLLDTIKGQMKKAKIPYSKIETDNNGKPKLGLLHKFDIMDAPLKTYGPWGGFSQGRGQVGDPMVGPTGIPYLQGVSVYQREVQDPKTKKSKVKRFIMTFRVVSSKHKGQGRWDRPEMPPLHLMEEGADWAKREWEQNIAPALVEEISSRF